MNHEYVFHFENIILKPLLETDIEQLRILRNKEKLYFATQNEIEREAQIKWYQNYLTKDDDIMFKIVKTEEPDTFIGAIALYDINWSAKQCECGRTVIDKELAPEKGIGLMATKAVCLFAFETLKFTKIIGEILKTNERIIKVDTRAGFYIVDENEKFYMIEMTRESINLAKKKTICDFHLNEMASIQQEATKEKVQELINCSGDRNPIHYDEEYALKSPFKKCIAHGLFCVGMISNLIGNVLPGPGAILLSQDFKYYHPVYIGDLITATVEIVEIDVKKKNISLSHVCVNQENVVIVKGISKVRLY